MKTEIRTGLLLVLLLACALARWTLMSSPNHFSWLPEHWLQPPLRSFTRQWLNVAASGLLLVMIPVLLTRKSQLVPHWGLGKPLQSRWILLATSVGIGLGVLAVSTSEAVRDAYPINHLVGASPLWLLLSEMLTCALILATEVFYRGGILFGLEQRTGPWAVYLVLPVYGFDHIGAPWSELVGSFFAGAVLGHLALRCRSIWPGFALHAATAVTVDLTAASWKGWLG